jgi:glycosyltransferase involved in cell wall biosynthesis
VRVLLVSANFRPSVGGIERYVEMLGEGLAARAHSVTVAACRTHESAREETVRGVRIVRIPATDVLDERLDVPYPLPRPVVAGRTLLRLIADADVVHAHDALYATSVLSLAIARRRQVPSVLTQHVAFVSQGNRLLDGAQRVAIATLGRSARLATRVVAYNPAVAAWAQATWGIAHVAVLPPGVTEAPPVDREAVRGALGLPVDRFVALFAGRDVAKKGLDVFLAAGDPAYELLAVTDRAAAGAPLGTRILPFLEPARFRELLGAVDAFVLPSESEGFPLSLQEALVAGLPCVVTAGPGYDHYLREGEALMIPRDPAAIRDALLLLAEDDQFRRTLEARSTATGAREFGVDRFVSAHEEIYHDAVESLTDESVAETDSPRTRSFDARLGD